MISVIARDSTFEWSELPRPPGDTAPPGQETILHRSHDQKFSCGFWKRVPESGALEPPFDEIMMILEGDIEVTHRDGEVLSIGPGDVLAAPHGTSARWHSFSPVYKFWVVHHGDASGAEVAALCNRDLRDVSEALAFTTPSGSFSAGLRACDGDVQRFDPSLEEVVLTLTGTIGIDRPDGTVERASTGDVILSPEGTSGTWRATELAHLFWAVYQPPSRT